MGASSGFGSSSPDFPHLIDFIIFGSSNITQLKFKLRRMKEEHEQRSHTEIKERGITEKFKNSEYFTTPSQFT